MKDVITTLIPRYGELNRIYKDWFDNKGFSFEKQKFITKFYLDYNDVTVLETAILELVFHLPQEQYTLILNSLKKEVCENISYYKKGCMPDEQTVYNICFRVSEIYKEAIEEQQYTCELFDELGIGVAVNLFNALTRVRNENLEVNLL